MISKFKPLWGSGCSNARATLGVLRLFFMLSQAFCPLSIDASKLYVVHAFFERIG